MTDKRTPRQWKEFLAQEETPVTLSEYLAGCVARELGCLIEIAAAIRHLEGMYGSLDDTLAERDPLYRELAERRGRSAPGALRGG
jgi:hypothetical protein